MSYHSWLWSCHPQQQQPSRALGAGSCSLQVSAAHYRSLFKVLEHCHTWWKVSCAVCMLHSIWFHDCVFFSAPEQPNTIRTSGWSNSTKLKEKKEGSPRVARHVNLLPSTLKSTQTTHRQAGMATKPCSVKRSATEARELQEQCAVLPHKLCLLRSHRTMPHWRRFHCCSQKTLQNLLFLALSL